VKKLIILLIIAPFLIFNCVSSLENEKSAVVVEKIQFKYQGEKDAPDFPPGLEWNNSQPLSIKDLKGKVVILDFWTYGCINCIHNFPYLKMLQDEFSDELVIIGVHSAKFSNEGVTENIRNIVRRYEIDHPVVNDKDFKVWRLWGPSAWPTLVLIDPLGRVIGARSGEG
jgi:thiol-disulfide isomerase/thioredoxin